MKHLADFSTFCEKSHVYPGCNECGTLALCCTDCDPVGWMELSQDIFEHLTLHLDLVTKERQLAVCLHGAK